jgi:hypothetical protein
MKTLAAVVWVNFSLALFVSMLYRFVLRKIMEEHRHAMKISLS